MASPLPFRARGICGSHDPEIVFRELVAALHLHLVSGKLGFPPERQVPFVVLPRIAAAVVRCDEPALNRLRSVPSSQILIHAVCPSMSAPRVPQAMASPACKLQRGRMKREGRAPAPYGGMAGPAPRMTRTRYIGWPRDRARGRTVTATCAWHPPEDRSPHGAFIGHTSTRTTSLQAAQLAGDYLAIPRRDGATDLAGGRARCDHTWSAVAGPAETEQPREAAEVWYRPALSHRLHASLVGPMILNSTCCGIFRSAPA